MLRITDKNLQAVVDRINRTTGSPMEPYGRDASGLSVAQIGNYHLDSVYGGVSLHRMVNKDGGASNVFNCGHVPKRELYGLLHALLAGFDAKESSHV